MKSIFDKTTLGNLTLKNRLIRSATWEGLANPDGSPPAEQAGLYKELAAGGVGTIIAGFTTVSGNDHYMDGMMRLSDDALIPAYKGLVAEIKRHGCVFMPQIALGAYVKTDALGQPRRLEIDDMSAEDIQEVVRLFAQAARRAQLAGFDGVQIHAAHGFFLSRCISPRVNRRQDAYGGSAEKRAQILVDVLEGIRSETEGLHITMKINCSDFASGGLTEEDCLAICKVMAEHGIDSIEVSGGGASRTGVRPGVNEGYFLAFAEALAGTVEVPVISVGGHRSVENMNRILNETSVEYLSLSRPLIREPTLPHRWQNGSSRPSACISCNACYDTPAHACIFNL